MALRRQHLILFSRRDTTVAAAPVAVTFQTDTPANEGGYTLPAGTTAVSGTNSADFTVSAGKLWKAAGDTLPNSPYTLTCNDTAATVLTVTAGGAGYDIGAQYDWFNKGAIWVSDTLIPGSTTIAANKAFSLLHCVNQPQDGSVVTVNAVAYTFKTTVVATNRQVKIGATLLDSLTNLADAINLAEANGVGANVAGGRYYATAAHGTVTAETYVDADGNWTVAKALKVTATTSGTNAYANSTTNWTANLPGGVTGGRGTMTEANMAGKAFVFRDNLELLLGWNGAVSGHPMRRFVGSTEIVLKSHNYAAKAVVVDRILQVGGTQALLGFKVPWDGVIGSSRIGTASTGTFLSNGLRVEDCEIYAWRAPGRRETFRHGLYSLSHPDKTHTWQGSSAFKTDTFTPNAKFNRNKVYYAVHAASIVAAGTLVEVNDNEIYSCYMYPWQMAAPTTVAPCQTDCKRNKFMRPYLNGGRRFTAMTATNGSNVVTGTHAAKAVEGALIWGSVSGATYNALTCFPVGTEVVSVASDGLSMTMSQNATADYTGVMSQKEDGRVINETYGGSWIPHMDMGIHSAVNTITATWVTSVANNLYIAGDGPGTTGPRAFRDNNLTGTPRTEITEVEGLWVQQADSGLSCWESENIKDAQVKRNSFVGPVDLFYDAGTPVMKIGIVTAFSTGTHHVSDNVAGGFSYPFGGDDGGNTSYGLTRATLTAAIQMAGDAGQFGDKLQPLTWFDAVATYAPISGLAVASGGWMKPDGTYIGALFPNGAWNDGSVYAPLDAVWAAAHTPIFSGLPVTP